MLVQLEDLVVDGVTNQELVAQEILHLLLPLKVILLEVHNQE